MNSRQEKILGAIVEEYTETAIAVGSEVLLDKYDFNVSSATIRADMSKLEKEGFLHQPHISAGRIPTDKGYRYFVEKIMPEQKLSLSDQKKLQTEILKLRAQKNRLTRTTAKLLASLSGSLAITGAKEELFDFGIHELLENPEFKNIDEFSKMAEALDYLDENVEAILKKVKQGETKIFIGQENPIKGIAGSSSMVVSTYKTKSGEKAVLALIGPKRMKYAKNKSILDYMKKLLSSSAVIIIVFGIWY